MIFLGVALVTAYNLLHVFESSVPADPLPISTSTIFERRVRRLPLDQLGVALALVLLPSVRAVRDCCVARLGGQACVAGDCAREQEAGRA